MRYLLQAFVLSFCVGNALGSEKNEIYTFDMYLHDDGKALYWTDKKYIDSLKTTCGMKCARNELFVKVSFQEMKDGRPHFRVIAGMQQDEQKERMRRTLRWQFINPITLIPFRYFINDQHIEKFKKKGDIIFSFSQTIEDQTKKVQIQIQLNSDFGTELSPQKLLQAFKDEPQCTVGNPVNEKGKQIAWQKTTNLKKELCVDGIIRKRNEDQEDTYWGGDLGSQYTHGLKSPFAEEIKREQETTKAQQKEESDLFYSRLKKFLCGGSIAAVIFMYLLYQQFYATAE